MAKLLSPDGACVGIDAAPSGRRYDGTIVEVSNRADLAALKGLGYTAASIAGTVARGGYRCECGFRPFIATCSRCGATCQREGEAAR